VTLKITVDEKSGFAPGLTLIGRNFSSPLGASLTSDATRVETIAFTYSFKDLLAAEKLFEKVNHRAPDCSVNEKGAYIDSNLKIGDFIRQKMVVASIPGTLDELGNASPYSVFNYETTFVVSYGGTATPTWTIAKVAVDSASAMLSASRQKTNDLSITLGLAKPATRTMPAQISNEAMAVHLSVVNAMFVASSIQSQTQR
jgi:hypothetical protein